MDTRRLLALQHLAGNRAVAASIQRAPNRPQGGTALLEPEEDAPVGGSAGGPAEALPGAEGATGAGNREEPSGAAGPAPGGPAGSSQGGAGAIESVGPAGVAGSAQAGAGGAVEHDSGEGSPGAGGAEGGAGSGAVLGVGESAPGESAGSVVEYETAGAEGAAGAKAEGAAGAEGAGQPGGEAAGAPAAGGGGGSAGAAGGETESGAGGGEALPDATEPAAPSPGPLGQLNNPPEAPTEAPAVEEAGEPAGVETAEEDLSGHAAGVESAANSGTGGSLLDAVVERARAAFRRVAAPVTNAVRGAIGAVTGALRGVVQGAMSLATSVVTGAITFVKNIATSAFNGVKSLVGSITSSAKNVVKSVLGAVSGVMSSIRGAISAAVQRALRGEPLVPGLLEPFRRAFDRIFGGIPAQITGLVTRITTAANTIVDRLIGGIASVAARIANGIGRLAATLQGAVTSVANTLSGVVGRATALVAGVPALLRPIVSALINALIAAVRAAIRAVQTAVNRIIGRIAERMRTWVQERASRVMAVINTVRAAVVRVITTIANIVKAGLARLAAFRDWLLAAARAAIGRLLKRVLEPLQRALMSLVLRLIGPQLAAAIANARLLFPNGLPTPPEAAATVAQAASSVGGRDESVILAGLTHPEGDHLSFGFTLGGSAGGAVGVSGGVAASLEVVMDYRRNDIGFFVSPGASGQVNVGDIGETGAATGNMSWGTVGSFGDKDKDVLQGWGGWFTNVNYGVQGGLAVEGGAAVASGGSVSVGGSTDFGTLGSYTPIGADQHPVPGAVTPGAIVGGTPAGHSVLALGEVQFPRQSADVAASPGGQAAIESAARTARDFPASNPGWQVLNIEVLGETSRVWVHPRSGESRATENQQLAARRAQNVKARLSPLVPDLTVNAVGNGDGRPANQGKGEKDASPEDQRASMTAATFNPGAPDRREPDRQGPPTTQGEPFDVKLGVPNPFAAGRSAWGWDTTVGASGLVGAAGRAGVYGGVGISYSFPVGKAHFSGTTMAIIRTVFGLVKVIGDIYTLSILGAIRDLIGMGWGVEALVTSTFSQAIGDWTIPLPPGVAVA